MSHAPELFAIAVVLVLGGSVGALKHWLDKQLRRPYWQILATERATGERTTLPLRYGSEKAAERARLVHDALHRHTHSYSLLRQGGAR
jgi:hypothetical protein